MVKAYLDKKVMLDEFVTHNMDLKQVNDAIELMKHGKWWVQSACLIRIYPSVGTKMFL